MVRPTTARPQPHRRRRAGQGFTLVELMVVISIILILVSIAVPIYNQSILRAREAVLRQDLYAMRTVIDQYTMDKGKAPQSLDDLVQAGYLKQIPKDPFTDSRDTWVVEQEDILLSVDQDQPGISDVHSGSEAVGSDGTAYSTW
jgi:general secretion pathway protein G